VIVLERLHPARAEVEAYLRSVTRVDVPNGVHAHIARIRTENAANASSSLIPLESHRALLARAESWNELLNQFVQVLHHPIVVEVAFVGAQLCEHAAMVTMTGNKKRSIVDVRACRSTVRDPVPAVKLFPRCGP